MKSENGYPETTQKLLKAIEENPTISQNELATALGITVDGVKYHIKNLTKKGVLKREGSDRAGKWIIVE